MSKDFPIVALGSLIHHRKEFIEIDDLESYKRCRVQLHAQGIVLRDIVKGVEVKTKKQQVCRAGEFLVAEIDAKLGGFGIVPTDLDGAIVSSHYFLFEINHRTLDRRFLDFFIRTPAFRDQVTAQGSTNYAAIRPSDVLGYQIPLLSLSEQRQIVARIEELATKIEEARRLRQQAVDKIELLWSAGAHQIFVSGANSKPLKELVKVRGGGTPSKSNPFFWQGPIPWISPKDMKRREMWDATDHISAEAIEESPAKPLLPGSVLIVVRGMILAHTVPSAVLRVPAAINQDMKALIPDEQLSAEYLCCILWAMNKSLLARVEKSTHDTRKLETHQLMDFAIPVPSLIEQNRIVAYLEGLQVKVDSLKRLQSETAAELNALLPSILDKAFKGEL